MDYRNRILAVDDDLSQLDLIEKALEPEYVLSLAPSGKQAVCFLSDQDVWIDLILLDVLMPGKDGFETLDAIRALPRYRDTPVIFLTSVSGFEAEIKGLRRGAEDYVTKPCFMPVLRERIALWLRQARCLDGKKLSTLPQSLSEKEFIVATLIAKGKTDKEIASMLNYAPGTARNLSSRVLSKLFLNSRQEIEQYIETI